MCKCDEFLYQFCHNKINIVIINRAYLSYLNKKIKGLRGGIGDILNLKLNFII